MSRIKLEIPVEYHFKTSIPVRICDINHGGHLGNDAVLGMVNEARVQFLAKYGYSELDIEGVGVIMADVGLIYKSEGFYGDVIDIEVAVSDFSKVGFDIYYKLVKKQSGDELALAKTGMVCYDYTERKAVGIPEKFRNLFNKKIKSMELQNKNAIVTGASKGIGLEVVKLLLNKGVKVAGWSRNNPKIKHTGFQFFKTDVTDFESVEDAYEDTKIFFKGIPHIIINNAGIGIFKLMEELTLEEWKKMFDVNVHGIFHVCKVALPDLKAKAYGHIVNIASTAAIESIPEATAYCGSKFAVRGISQTMYKEVKKHNIKVSCIYPGSVNTDFFVNYPGITANETMLHPEDLAASIVHTIETPDNFDILNIEVRPMNPSYK